MGKKEKPKEVNLGTFRKAEDIKLINDFDIYIKKCNSNRLDFFRNAIRKELEGKVLTNDFITLEEPFYINMKELKDNGRVKASVEVPIHDLYNTYFIDIIPNNLDEWNEEAKTFSSGKSSSIHKGIVIYFDIINTESLKFINPPFSNAKILDFNLVSVEYCYLFRYDSAVNELEISSINTNQLELYVPTDEILNKFEAEIEDYYSNILSEDNEVNVDVLIEEDKKVIFKKYKVKKTVFKT